FERLLAAAGEPRSETPVAQAGERLHRSGRRLQLRTAVSRAGPAEQPIFIESFFDPGPPEPAASASSQPRHAAEALRESQERFRAFMDNTPVAAWQADADGRIVLANPAYAWFTGYSAAEVVGKTIDELFPPEQAQAYRTRDREVLRTGQAQEWRLSFQRGDGTPCESLIINFPVPGPAGQRMIGAIALDLTEHQLLREQIHQQAQLLSHGPQAVITWNPQGRIRSWNRGAELAFGYSAEQALELDITELLRTGAPAGVADHTPSLVSLLRQNQGEPLEVELGRHDGEPFFAQILCIPLSDSEGAPLGTIAYVQDITQRKRIEEELGVQQARTQGIVNTAVDVILTVCDQGLIESANPAVRRLLGYEPEELVGQHVSVILVAGLAPFPEEYLRLRPPSGEHRSVGTSREVTARARDGREIPVQTSVGEMRLGDRRVFAIIIHDLTDRKLLEMQFLQSQKMEAVGLLAGGVAHDFNNLLTAINGYSDLLLRTVSPTSSTYSMVQEIHLAGTRAVTLTRQLLAFSRKQVLAPVVLSLSRVVADMVKLLDRLVGEDVVLQTVLAENLWPCRADLGQLEQVIMNLAVNARDAMPGGGQLTLATSNLTIDDPAARLPVGDYVCLTVTDSGCGMDAATQARLFEPFFTTKEVGRGTGLGLATVYGIVKQSEGFILVDSALGRGTTFRVLLPRTQAVASPLAVGPPRRDSPAGAEVILLVEDEVSVRTMTQRLLQRGGYTVLSAGSAGEAERLFASHPGPVHLLLTDIVMPGPNGIELSTRLRRQRPELAVLYISGYAEGSLPARSALPAGAMLLAKPFSSDALLSRVREVLDRAGRRRRSRSDPGN
ncbi:MAG TPA: PAS domain S-box protein, partial [Pseudomonadota bacterium]|nr:PAS domain S-box protein [Pseudomonadota bacterium]